MEFYSRASLVAQLVKNLPAMREAWVRSLGWEDPLVEGKGYSLQYSGLENSMDCIAHGVTKSRTQLSDFYFQCLENTKMTQSRGCVEKKEMFCQEIQQMLHSRGI